MGRLALPWQLVRLATRAAESDQAARVAETPFAEASPSSTEIECMVSEMRAELKARGRVTSLLKGLHVPRLAGLHSAQLPRRGSHCRRIDAVL